MAWGWVQNPASAGTGGNSSANLTVQFASNCTTGNRIIVALSRAGASETTTLSDGGNSYTLDATATDGNGWIVEVWSAPITTGGGTQITVTSNVTGGSGFRYARMGIAEYSGLSTASGASAVGAAVAAANAGNTPPLTATSGNTAATTVASELQIGAFSTSPVAWTSAAAGGATQRYSAVTSPAEAGLAFEDVDSGVAGAKASTFAITGTGFNAYSVACVVYKLAAAAAASPGFFASVGKPGPRVSNRTGRLQGGY